VAKKTVTIEGREIEAEETSFRLNDSGEVRIDLDDGTILHLRTIVLDVMRTNETTPDGQPRFLVRHMPHLRVEVPDKAPTEAP